MWRKAAAMGVLTGFGVTAMASDVHAAHKFAWSENAGWLNFRDAGEPVGAAGMRVLDTFLSGKVWSENVGWIELGDGTPADGLHYGNQLGTDFGVNLDPETRELFGMAWGENVGWVNFEGGAIASPAAPARLEIGGCRLAGMVWGENVGWINLGDGARFVGLAAGACSAGLGDMDCNGVVSVADIGPFVRALTNPALYAADFPGCDIMNGDVDGNGVVSVGDIGAFVALLVS